MKKVIIITGDSSGIGKELCNIYKKDNIVYGISRREIECDYKHFSCDVLDYEKLKKIIEEIYNENGHIDLLVCSAGCGVSGAVECFTKDDINFQMGVNFDGVINTDKAVIPYMRKQHYGRIIHISSVAAIASMPFQSFYSASKAALNSYSFALRNELRPFNIEITSIMPGDFKSNFTSSRRKIIDKNSLYEGRVENATKIMEEDEQNGDSLEKVTKEVSKIIDKKKVKELYTIGVKYKLLAFLIKVLPINFVNKILYKMYAK